MTDKLHIIIKKTSHDWFYKAALRVLPVVKENLLIMICSLNEAKIVLQCGNKSINLLGDCTVEEPHRHCTLQAGAFHLTNRKLHLRKAYVKGRRVNARLEQLKIRIYILFIFNLAVIIYTPCLRPVDEFLPPGLWYGMAHWFSTHSHHIR